MLDIMVGYAGWLDIVAVYAGWLWWLCWMIMLDVTGWLRWFYGCLYWQCCLTMLDILSGLQCWLC
jgi:hypothetical protein